MYPAGETNLLLNRISVLQTPFVSARQGPMGQPEAVPKGHQPAPSKGSGLASAGRKELREVCNQFHCSHIMLLAVAGTAAPPGRGRGEPLAVLCAHVVALGERISAGLPG